MKILGYTYTADIHCPSCAWSDAATGILTRKPPLSLDTDEHGLAYDLYDREGNGIGVLYDIEEAAQTLTHCGDCHEEL